MSTLAEKSPNALRSLLFVAVLTLPIVQLVYSPINLKNYQLAEVKKGGARAPIFQANSVMQYPDRFEKYFEKSFGFRDLLVRTQASLRFHLLGVSPTPKVLTGKDGWLFYAGHALLAFFQGTNRFSPRDLKILQEAYETRYRYLESQGIKYFLVLVPNKESVYPEYFPQGVRKVNSQSRYDQFVQHMRENSKVAVVDLKPALLANKSLGQLYRKSDGHWNNLGAFVGYEEIAKKLKDYFPKIKPLTMDHYKVAVRSESGDLGRMMGLLSPPSFDTPMLIPIHRDPWYEKGKSARGSNKPLLVDREQKLQGKSGVRPDMEQRILVYRDSFFAALTPFVSKHFVMSHYYTTHKFFFDPFVVEEIKPQVVIDQMVERYLNIPRRRELALMRHRIKGEPLSSFGRLVFDTSAFQRQSDSKLYSPAYRFSKKRSYGVHIKARTNAATTVSIGSILAGKPESLSHEKTLTLPAGEAEMSARIMKIQGERQLVVQPQGGILTELEASLREL